MTFAAALLAWFERHGRRTLPWRTDRAPYRIVVSEFMLQQTQVDRVVPIFEAFVARWPTFAALAGASQADVVRAWKGLGYNSRAVRLYRLAREVAGARAGTLPRAETSLRELPGIGPYTARAIAAFAFDADAIAFDTNVRRIVHRTQFGIEWPPLASDATLDARALALLPHGAGYAFNSALMDLGATLCTARAPKCLLCPLQAACASAPIDAAGLAALASRHAKPASPQERIPFESTTRYVRGRIIDRLRELEPQDALVPEALFAELATTLARRDEATIAAIVDALVRDGVVERSAGGLRLAS